MATTTDYDAPRRSAVDLEDDSIEDLKTRRSAAQAPALDVDDADVMDNFDLPGAELLDEELSVTVVPMRSDEFRCSRCFLVHHRSQLARREANGDVCRECG